MKDPSACSSEVLSDKRMTSMVNLIAFLGSDLVSKDESGCQSLDVAPRKCMSGVGTDISMLSLVC